MPDTEYNVYDIWSDSDEGTVKNKFKSVVASHGAKLYKIY